MISLGTCALLRIHASPGYAFTSQHNYPRIAPCNSPRTEPSHFTEVWLVQSDSSTTAPQPRDTASSIAHKLHQISKLLEQPLLEILELVRYLFWLLRHFCLLECAGLRMRHGDGLNLFDISDLSVVWWR